MYRSYIFVERDRDKQLYWSGTIEDYLVKLEQNNNYFKDTALFVEFLNDRDYKRYCDLYNALLRNYWGGTDNESDKQYEERANTVTRIRSQMEIVKLHSYDDVPAKVLLNS